MKKRILSLFLAFSLAAGIGVAGAGNNAEAASSSLTLGGLNFTAIDRDYDLYTLTPGDMVNTISSFYAYPNTNSPSTMQGYVTPTTGAVSLMLAQDNGSNSSGLGDVVSAANLSATYGGNMVSRGGAGLVTLSATSTRSAQTDWRWMFENGGSDISNKLDYKPGTFYFGDGNSVSQMAIRAAGQTAVAGNPRVNIAAKVPYGAFVSAGAFANTTGFRTAFNGSSDAAVAQDGNYAFKQIERSANGTREALLPAIQSSGAYYFAGYVESQPGTLPTNSDRRTILAKTGDNNLNSHYTATSVTPGMQVILLDYSQILRNKGVKVDHRVVTQASEQGFNDGYGYSIFAGTRATVGSMNLPVYEIDGVKYGSWREVDINGVTIAGQEEISSYDAARTNNTRIFVLNDDGNTNPAAPTTGPETLSTLSGTGKYGTTLKATDAYSTDGTKYTWYRAIFKKTAANNGKTYLPGTVVELRSSNIKADAPNELVITDVYRDYSEHTSLINKGYRPVEWDFRESAVANDEEYRVWCEITRTTGTTYATRSTKVERTILDRTDFVYGTNQESYVTWKAGSGDDESDIIDPVFRNASNADIPIALRNGLSSQGYYFEIRYRDADQAKEVDAGDVNGVSKRAASKYYVDGTLEESLNGQMSINGQKADRTGRTGYGYNFLTGEELRKSGQVGKYEVYVVGIYQNVDHKRPSFTSSTNYKVGVNGEITSTGSSSGQAYETDGNMAVRNQNNALKVGTVTYDDMRWGYALKDDDSAETLGDKTGHNVPALMIGTLNIQKAKWPASAGLHVAADDNSLPEYDNQTGYLVDNTFDVTEVNVPEKWAKLDTFEWFRVDTNGNWEPTGKTGRKYTAGAADVGYYLGVRASNNNYEGTIEGTTHQVIAKRELTVNFTKTGASREGHFSNGGQFTVDMRSLLAPYGDALGDVTMELKTNVSGEGTIEKAVYSASDKNLVITFKSFDSVPATFAPYTVSGAIEFPGYIINVKGDVRGTAADVNKIVIEPIETKEYDGVGVATTAKVYVNEVEVTDGSNVAIRYEGIDVNYNDTKGPSNRGKYRAVATWKDQTAEAEFQIKRRKLTAGDSIAKQYNVGANLPQNLTGYFNIVQKDNVQVHNFVTKFNIDEAGVTNTGVKWNTARTSAGNYVNVSVLNKVFYTPTFDIGGNYWMQFKLSGTADALDNYTAPDALAIQVGSGYTNASSSNVSTSDPYAEQIAKINREWKAGDVHRMRYAANGEYLYTSDKNEAITNVRNGWTFEAALFKGLAQGTANAKELVRLEKNGERVTTIKGTNEYNVLIGRGYVDNGLIAYVYDSAVEGAIQYNRLYHPRTGLHLVQNVADNEYKSLLEGGTWQDEGAQFWALVP